MHCLYMIVSVACLFVYFHRSHCFNLDTQDPIIFNPGKRGYYFGYSLALHKYKNKNWLIVGAPLANDTSQGYKPRFGAVYRCDLDSKRRRCHVMRNFDIRTSGIQSSLARDDEFKTGQWMGATVRSSVNHIMACAPRFAWPGSSNSNKNYYFPIGKCEIIDTEDSSKRWIWEPCRYKGSRHKEKAFGFCSFGLDASFSSNGKALAGGAVGLVDHQGRLIGANLFSQSYYLSASKGGNPGEMLGYAVIFGKIGLYGREVLIGGAPNGDLMKGKVLVFGMTYDLPVLKIISNPSMQIGSFFGASLAVADVNGDGFQDLLIGAPTYSLMIEEGAVFVYINNRRDNLDFSDTYLHGDSTQRSRFGTVITAAGDLDNDGFEDIVIGAPYGGEDGRGAVYIYHGSRDGLQTSYSQKLIPAQFGLVGLSLFAFGNAISGGVDVDGNGYPDLAIGSFLSDRAVYLRSRPVVMIRGKVALAHTQFNPKSISQLCTSPDGIKHLCLSTWVCFSVGGKSVPQPVDVSYEYIIDSEEPIHKRGVFITNSQRSYRVSRTIKIHRHKCVNHTVYLTTKPKSVYNPLVFKVLYNYQPQWGCKLCPTMKPGTVQAMATYAKNCGADLICEADISLAAKFNLASGQTEVHVGVTETINLEIELHNSGENAFLSRVVTMCPVQLSVIGVHSRIESSNTQWKIDNHNKTHNRLIFDAGNPIGPRKRELYDIKFTVKTISSTLRRLTFTVKAETCTIQDSDDTCLSWSSKDLNMDNNQATLSIKTLVIADITVSGMAVPEQLTYNETKKAEEIGPILLHSFLIQNKGPSTVQSSSLRIHFPEKLQDQFLLNLFSVTVDGSAHCKINKTVYDPLDLKVHKAKSSNSKKLSSRRRRAVEQRLDCSLGKCRILQCDIGRLRRGENVVIKLNSSLVEATVAKVVKRNSLIVVRADVLPDAVRQPSLHFPDSAEVTVQILPPRGNLNKEKTVPWWIILISVIAGLVLVAGVIFVFHKSGFFNRKKEDYTFDSVPTVMD